jgi:hypothetical protein
MPERVQSPLASPVKPANPYTGEPFCWINGFPVTPEQLNRFSKLLINPGHSTSPHGDAVITPSDINLMEILDSFRRYFAVAQEGSALGFEEDESVRTAQEAFEFSIVGSRYRTYLYENAPLDTEAIMANVPPSWVQMNFQIKLLDAGKDVDRDVIPVTEEEWKALPYTPITENRVPETGMQFPGSGYFDDADEGYLFTLEEGDIFGPVLSGLGQAVVRVKEKKVFTAEEQQAYIDDMRRKLSLQYVTRRFENALRSVDFLFTEETLGDALRREMANGTVADIPLFKIGDLTITYNLWRELDRTNLGFFANLDPGRNMVPVIGPEIRIFAGRMALGGEGIEEGFTLDHAVWDKAKYDFYILRLYNLTMARMEESFKGEVKEPNEAELEAYFNARSERYGLPPQAAVTYLTGPSLDQLKGFLERIQAGTLHLESIPATELMRSPHGGQEIQRAIVARGSPLLSEFQSYLFSMDQGETMLLSSRQKGKNHYLIRLDERKPGKTVDFKQAREQVERDYRRYQWATPMNAWLDDLVRHTCAKCSGPVLNFGKVQVRTGNPVI